MLKKAGVRPRGSTRQRLKAVALDCFLEVGFRGTTIAEIARRGNTSKPLVLYHLQSTDEILKELMADWDTYGREVFNRALRDHVNGSVDNVVAAVWDSTREWMKRNPKMAQLSVVLYQASREIKMARQVMINYHNFTTKRRWAGL
jgi:AcrR family transcriptional regulator